MARQALFVSSSTYADVHLAQLPSAARDAIELGDLFADPRIGQFTVSALESPTAQELRLALEDLFADAEPNDLVVLYLSGHGLKDMQGNLYFAAHDTRPDRLHSTAVSAQLLCSLLNSSRAESAVVFLDCCYGGAFARGMVARAAGDPQVGDAFATLGAGARSRAVITASSAIEYAFEGDRLTDEHVEPSVFASAMRDGIADGDADQDGDGWVGLNELFDYLGQRIRRLGRPQTPHLWTFGASGDLRVTRSPRGPRASASALPAEIRELLASPVTAARLGAVADLEQRALEPDLATARAAVAALAQLSEDDSLRVRGAATQALTACTPLIEPAELIAAPGTTARARLTGPPVALDAYVEPTPNGITAAVTGSELTVHIDETAPSGEVELGVRWAGGILPVTLTVATESSLVADPRPKGPEPVDAAPAEQQPAGPAPTTETTTGARRPAALWSLATAVIWLVSLFVPMNANGTGTVIGLARDPEPAIMTLVGLALAGIGIYRYQRTEGRVSLVVALVLTALVQVMAVVVLGDIVHDGEENSSEVVVLIPGALVVSVVTLVLEIRRLGQRSPHLDRPTWLIASGTIWIAALFLPMDYAGGFDRSPFLEQFNVSETIALLLLLAGIAAIGAGLVRLRPPEMGQRISTGVAIAVALLLGALSTNLVVFTTTYDEPGQAGMLALEPLAFALVYLVDLFVRAVKPRLRPR